MRSKLNRLFVLFVGCALIFGCFSSDHDGVSPDEEPAPPPTEEALTPAVIVVGALQDSIPFNSTTQVTATLYDDNGSGMPGIPVYFTLDSPEIAFITAAATSNNAGVATATFSSRNLTGEVQVSARAGRLTSATPKLIVIYDGTTPSSISVSSNPTAVSYGGTATITATVLDSEGNTVANGTQVVFEIGNSSFGTVTGTATTNAGVATATFTAARVSGTAVISARAGTANASTGVVILSADASSIEFISAIPDRIAIAGTGVNETSRIQFRVNSSGGDPIEGETVTVTMEGPNGGEYIDPSGDGTPGHLVISSNALGVAEVILNSGSVAGPVTLRASITVGGITVTVNSSVVSIGGGVPSAKRFTAAASHLNVPGLEWVGALTDITAFLADRFGNYNILKGTTVSFSSETGLTIDTSKVTLEEDGLATVTARTQNLPEDVVQEPWEVDLRNYVTSTFTFASAGAPSGYPRDGVTSILVYTKGEEHFDDSNANGMYDSGEPFIDTFDDPFCDFNDDGIFTEYTGPTPPADPQDFYIDSEPINGIWDGKNGKWDSSKNIFLNFPILITGKPEYIGVSKTSFAVPEGGSDSLIFYVSDRNMNPPVAGTTVEISADVGLVVGRVLHTFGEINQVGPTMESHLSYITFPVTVWDDTIDENPVAETSQLSITVTWTWQDDGGADLSYEETVTVFGTVN
ncbi:MAG: Ig-like domain-containing protein [Desulfobacterales bacterium]